MAFLGGHVDVIVASVRAGTHVTIPRDDYRGHAVYWGRDGHLMVSYSDGGEQMCSEAELRAIIYAHPDAFQDALRDPYRVALRDTLLAGHPEARDRLRDLFQFGKSLPQPELLVAVLEWPAKKPDPQIQWLLGRLSGLDVYNAIMAALQHAPATKPVGECGVRFFATLQEILGRELPTWRRYRGWFRFVAGDSEGALEDLEWARAQMASGDADLANVNREIATLRDAPHIAAIVAAPDDDAPRLVWADVLTERGDPRGELIVAQCTIASLDEDDPARMAMMARVMQLVALHGRSWGERGDTFARGFVDSAAVSWCSYAKDIERALAVSPPLRELRFRVSPGESMSDPAVALEDPRLERFVALDCSDPNFRVGGEVAAFGSAVVARLEGRWPRLRELTMRGATLGAEDVARIGARTALTHLDLAFCALDEKLEPIGALRELRHLNVAHCKIRVEDVGVLRRLERLEELELGDNPVGLEGAHVVARLGSLRRLRLYGTGLDNDGVAAIADLPVRFLVIDDNDFDTAAIEALARGRSASSIQRLYIGHKDESPLDDGVAPLLAKMPRLWEIDVRGSRVDGVALLDALPLVRALRLGRCSVDDDAVAKLVAHPRFTELDTLELDYVGLGPDAGATFARAPRLPCRLVLAGNSLRDEGARALAAAPAAARIVDLDLRDNDLTDEGVGALLDSPHLANVATLALEGNRALSDAVKEACEKKLGKRVGYD